MAIPKVEIIDAVDGEFQAIYVNGRKVTEGHSLTPADVLTALRIPFSKSTADEAWLQRVGQFPQNQSDVFYDLG